MVDVPNSVYSFMAVGVFTLTWVVFTYFRVDFICAMISIILLCAFFVIGVIQVIYSKYKSKKKLQEDLENLDNEKLY